MSAAPRTITVAGSPIRLYPAPQPGVAFPWVEFNDLLRATDFSPACIADWAWRWLSTYPERSHTLPDGRLLVPSESARGLFEAARSGGWAPAEQALDDYQNGSSSYFLELHRHLDGAAFRVALNEAVLRSAVGGVAH